MAVSVKLLPLIIRPKNSGINVPSKTTALKPSKPLRKKESNAGRRRDSTKHRDILQATRELVEEKGYRSLSLKAIASRSNVSRNVLYNWWDGDIRHIVEEALLPNVKEWSMPNTGNFKDDYRTVFRTHNRCHS